MPGKRTRGQRAGLTRQAILDAAMRLVDREGLSALSMRRLGIELGVEAMTLYHYVANKDELLDGLVEQLIDQGVPPVHKDAPWDAQLRELARSLHATLLAHPNLVSLMAARSATTERNLRLMEQRLATLRAAGFHPTKALDVLYAVIGFAVGQAAISVRDGNQSTSHGQSGSLADVNPEEFPLIAEAARSAPNGGVSSRFDFALDALLSGLAAARTTEGAEAKPGEG